MNPRPTCRYHCRGCDSHFTSLKAFDAHRIGSPQDRDCGDPDEIRNTHDHYTLGVKSERAVCFISGGPERLSVTLYATAADLARESPWNRRRAA